MDSRNNEEAHATTASTIPIVNKTRKFHTVGVSWGSTLSYPIAINVPIITSNYITLNKTN